MLAVGLVGLDESGFGARVAHPFLHRRQRQHRVHVVAHRAGRGDAVGDEARHDRREERIGDRDVYKRQGYAVRERQDSTGVLLAAKKGSANRLGYVFAHAAMVIICVGGLLDSELPVRLQVMFGGKKPIVENMLISEVPESGRLSVNNPSFRASVLVRCV